jgi:type I restriction enzyme S subunit
MSPEYPQVVIGSVAKVRSGFAFKSSDWQSDGIPVVKIANVKDGRLEMDGCSYVSEAIAKQARDFQLEKGDILISMTGYVGDVARVRAEDVPCALNQRVGRFHSYDEELLDPSFLFFHLRSVEVRGQIEKKAYGSAQPNVSASGIEEAFIYLPSLKVQQAIALILGSLDDKIELNRKTNETLEAMAKALFQSWFVDFDPVRAKAEGRPTGLPDEISELFPDSFEETELGEIPRGWEVKALDEIAHFLNGLALQKFSPEEGGATLPVIKIAQLKKGDSTGADRCSTSVPAEYVVRDGDVLFSWSGSLAIDIWSGGDGALNQHLFKVTSKTYGKWFFYQWVKHYLPVFQEIAQEKATTMGHIQRHHLSEVKTLVPGPSLLGAMDSVFATLLDRAFALRRQSSELSSIRDTLLPKLISGELRIPEAEKLVSNLG